MFSYHLEFLLYLVNMVQFIFLHHLQIKALCFLKVLIYSVIVSRIIRHSENWQISRYYCRENINISKTGYYSFGLIISRHLNNQFCKANWYSIKSHVNFLKAFLVLVSTDLSYWNEILQEAVWLCDLLTYIDVDEINFTGMYYHRCCKIKWRLGNPQRFAKFGGDIFRKTVLRCTQKHTTIFCDSRAGVFILT